MYAYLKGIIEDIEADRVVIDVNNIGYNVFVPSSVMVNIGYTGEEVKLYTYLSVREDAMNLFGFLTKDDLKLFKLLITVNGIGPKAALSILGVMSSDDLRFAIISGDSKSISKAPGVGAKTAQKVILELKDKLSVDDLFSKTNSAANGEESFAGKGVINDAILALTSLGYSQLEASRAVKQCSSSEEDTVQGIIKEALKILSK